MKTILLQKETHDLVNNYTFQIFEPGGSFYLQADSKVSQAEV